MNRNSNLNPLPWYESIEEQGYRKPWAYGKVWPLLAHKDYFLPFQIVFPGAPTNIKFYVHQVESGRSFEITAAMTAAGYAVASGNYVVGIYPALYRLDWATLGLDFNDDFDESFGGEDHTSIGRYYLSMEYQIEGVTKHMYSEVMTLVEHTGCLLRLEWFSYANLPYNGGEIVYSSSSVPTYMNFLWIPADIAMPDYTFEEEGEERDGFFFATKQISEKTYRFAFLATEEICDALRIVGLSDVVSIVDQVGRRYMCDKFSMTPDWQQQGYLAAVACEFQTDTVVIRRAGAYSPASSFRAVVTGRVTIDIIPVPSPMAGRYIFVPGKGGEFVITGYPGLDSVESNETWAVPVQVDNNSWKVTVAKNASGATRDCVLTLTWGSVTQAWRPTQVVESEESEE